MGACMRVKSRIKSIMHLQEAGMSVHPVRLHTAAAALCCNTPPKLGAHPFRRMHPAGSSCCSRPTEPMPAPIISLQIPAQPHTASSHTGRCGTSAAPAPPPTHTWDAMPSESPAMLTHWGHTHATRTCSGHHSSVASVLATPRRWLPRGPPRYNPAPALRTPAALAQWAYPMEDTHQA